MKLFRSYAAVSAFALTTGSTASCGEPPSYLLLRRVESPGKNHHPGHADRPSGWASMSDAQVVDHCASMARRFEDGPYPVA